MTGGPSLLNGLEMRICNKVCLGVVPTPPLQGEKIRVDRKAELTAFALLPKGPVWRQKSTFGSSNAFGSILLPKWHVWGWYVLGRSGRVPPGFCAPSNVSLRCRAFWA